MGAQITNFGPVKDVFAAGTQAQRQAVWVGAITMGETPEAHQAAQKQLDAVLPSLNDYYAPVDLTAPSRCIDGRIVEGYAHTPALQRRPLGPQIPGGTPAGAFVHRILLMGERDADATELSFDKDLKGIIRLFTDHGMYFGGHIDDGHNTHDENTGCGAIDKLPDIVRKMVQPEAWTQLQSLARHLLGDIYDDMLVNQVSGRLLRFEAAASSYLDQDEHSGRYRYKQRAMEIMRESATDNGNRPVEKLAGPHLEKGLVVNTLPGTTFDRDRFSYDHDNAMQLFSWDSWRSRQVAEILYPTRLDMGYADSKRMLRRRYEFLHCRTMYALATAMVLTDGTLPLLIRD